MTYKHANLLFELMLYFLVNNLRSNRNIFHKWTFNQYLAVRKKWLAQGHNTVPLVGLLLGTFLSEVEHSSNEALGSSKYTCNTTQHANSKA